MYYVRTVYTKYVQGKNELAKNLMIDLKQILNNINLM